MLHGAVPVDELREVLTAELGRPGRSQPEEVALSLTDGERRLMERARTEAVSRGAESVASEHVLLGVLRAVDSPAARALVSHGFTYEAAVAHVDAVTVRHDPPPGSPTVV
jgi:ATP-dependent Clp protease ATP-binding subunit ClpA